MVYICIHFCLNTYFKFKAFFDILNFKIIQKIIATIMFFICSCGRILIPQGVLICRILLQSLNMTNFSLSKTVYGTTRTKL